MSYAPDFGDMLDGLANDHVVSRSVRDTAAALDATAGCIEGDAYWAPEPPLSYRTEMTRRPKQLRIAFSTSKTDGSTVHPDCVAAIEQAVQLCEDHGHIVEEATPKLNPVALIPAFMTFWASHLAAGIDHIARLTRQTPRDDQFEGVTWGLYEMGKRIGASEYLLAKGAMQHAAREAAAFHKHYDVWLSSTLASPPVRLGTFNMTERDPQKAFAPLIDYVQYTAMQNVTGQPAISLPLYWNEAGLPIGVHFVGRYGDETTLLQLAAQLEQAAPWAQRRPNLED
jgi:amidase